MPITSSIAARQLSDGNSVGTCLGISSTDVIGFYGTTTGVARLVVVGSTITAQSGVISTAPASTGGANNITTWGFTTLGQAQMVVSTMVALYQMGLIG